MVEVLIFPHALGVTDGLRSIAAEMVAAGQRARIVDVFDGRTFDTVEAGVAHAEQVGFDVLIDRGVAAAGDDPTIVVGFSLGVLPAQKLAQTHVSVLGAFLCDAFVSPSFFGEWRDGLAVQIHLSEGDELVAEDLDAARAMQGVDGVELTLHPGTSHLAVDPSAPGYEVAVATHIRSALAQFLADLGT